MPRRTSTQPPPLSEGGALEPEIDPALRGLRAFASKDGRLEQLESVERIRAAHRDAEAELWVDLEDPDPALVQRIGEELGIHPLIVEDLLERDQRAKIERTGDQLQVVMFALAYEGELLPVEINFVLGPRFLVTAHTGEWRPHRMPRIRDRLSHYLGGGADFVLYALVDSLVDDYFPVFDRIGDEIDALQDDVVARPAPIIVERIFHVRRELLAIRRAISPEREIFNQLTSRAETLIDPARIIYFRDVYDHLIRLTDELDTYRELVSGTLDAYLSTVNNNLSEVMRRLTAVTVVVAGIGAVAGIFGMSEAASALEEGPGFWIITAMLFAAAGAGLIYFRRIGWL